MRRPRRRLEVSTFPFLAVLLCAMGSLILLLLVLDRRAKAVARAKAEEAAETVRAEQDAAARAAADAAAARAAERARRREELHGQLAREQRQLAGRLAATEGDRAAAARVARVEKTRWQEMLAALGTEREDLDLTEKELAARRGTADQANELSEAARKDAERLSTQLRGLELALAQLKAARQRDARTWSVVPYRGKRGDGRRPLYVECTARGLVFHPDRKPLDLGTGSLADVRREVEARVARQRAAVRAAGGTPDKSAYLLMLVRPDGISRYYETLAALGGMDVDFGYEFIDAGWVLDFPDSDDAPPKQPWMDGDKVVAVPGGPSPTRQVAGLPRGEGARPQLGTGEGGGRGNDDLPPLPGAEGGLAGGGTGGGTGGGPSRPPGGSGRGGAGSTGAAGANGATGGPSDGPALPSGRSGGALAGAGGQPGGSGTGTGASAGGQPGGSGVGGQPGGSGGWRPSSDGAMQPPVLPPPAPGGGAGSPAFPGTGPGGRGTAPNGGGAPSSAGGGGAPQGAAAPQGGSPGGLPPLPGERPAGGGAPGSQGQGDGTGAPPGGGTPAPGGAPQGGAPKGGATGTPGGESGDSDEPPGRPFGGAPGLPGDKPPRSPYAAAPPRLRLIGNRDWVIPVECRADGVVIKTAGQKVPLAALAGTGASDNALSQGVRRLIARRQAEVRAGDPPYRPQVRFVIYPGGLRTYYAAFPLLEPLGIPLTRQDAEAERAP